MVEDGLVTKKACPSDRRRYFVATAKGRRAIRRRPPGHVGAARRLFIDLLSEHGREVIAEGTEQARVALDDAPRSGAGIEEKTWNRT